MSSAEEGDTRCATATATATARDASRIPHRAVPEDLFEAECPMVSASERERRISRSPFLQALIERRPEDAVDNPDYVKFLSPMVRYSKLPFRLLCRRYGADLAFTPMLIARDFISSRNGKGLVIDEFATCAEDRPLVAQLAANDGVIAHKAAQFLAPFVDGFDINCGCPQTWVLKEGIGGALSSKPELVEDIVKQVRAGLPPLTPLSIKIRLRPNLTTTLELVRRAEKMGVEWITVHGRTKEERTSVPVSKPAIRLLRSAIQIPLIFNGDIVDSKTLREAIEATNADGVLIARGALSNPAIFTGVDQTPAECIRDYLALSAQYGGCGSIGMDLHHVLYMTYGAVDKVDRLRFAQLNSMAGIYSFCSEMGWLHKPVGTSSILDLGDRESNPLITRVMAQYEFPELGDRTLASKYAKLYSPSAARMKFPDTLEVKSMSDGTPVFFGRDCGGVARMAGFQSTKLAEATRLASEVRTPSLDPETMLGQWPYYSTLADFDYQHRPPSIPYPSNDEAYQDDMYYF